MPLASPYLSRSFCISAAEAAGLAAVANEGVNEASTAAEVGDGERFLEVRELSECTHPQRLYALV